MIVFVCALQDTIAQHQAYIDKIECGLTNGRGRPEHTSQQQRLLRAEQWLAKSGTYNTNLISFTYYCVNAALMLHTSLKLSEHRFSLKNNCPHVTK